MIFVKKFAEKTDKKPEPTRRSNSLYPVLTAEQLTRDAKRRFWLAEIQRLFFLSEDAYELLCAPLLKNFIECVQVLPASNYGKLAGLLDAGLGRAYLALLLHHEQEPDNRDILLRYAIFTLALLQDVGKVVALQKVMICDAQGLFIRKWQPGEGNMVGNADYYKIRALGDQWVNLGQTITPLLARQLMGVGFKWLSQNYAVMQMWLAALLGDEAHAGRFALLLSIIDKRFAELQRNELPLPVAMEIKDPEATALAEDFLNWLKEGLADGSIEVNKPDGNVHVVEDGLFIEIDAFKDYAELKKITNLVVLQKGFNHLGLSPLDGERDLKFKQFFAELLVKPDAGGLNSGLSYFNQNKTATGMKKFPSREQAIVERAGFVIDLSLIYTTKAAPPVDASLKSKAPSNHLDSLMTVLAQPTQNSAAPAV